MKTLVKTNWPAILAVTLITAFAMAAAIAIINMTQAGVIDWSR